MKSFLFSFLGQIRFSGLKLRKKWYYNPDRKDVSNKDLKDVTDSN